MTPRRTAPVDERVQRLEQDLADCFKAFTDWREAREARIRAAARATSQARTSDAGE